MEEYIGKGAAISMVQWIMSDSPSITREDWNAVVDGLNGIPSADVRPVVRGRWIPDEIAAYDRDQEKKGWVPWLCSECGWSAGKHQTAFCPSCGADMRGTQDE